jgi:hypothetical protein
VVLESTDSEAAVFVKVVQRPAEALIFQGQAVRLEQGDKTSLGVEFDP